jgi:hypothetical protein
VAGGTPAMGLEFNMSGVSPAMGKAFVSYLISIYFFFIYLSILLYRFKR